MGWLLAAVLVCDVGEAPAQAAPTAEQKAAKKAAREQKQAQREQKRAADKKGAEAAKPDRTPREPPVGEAKRAAKRPPPSSPSPSAPGGPALPACPPDNTLTWRSFGAGFLRTWCTGCHSSTLPEDGRQDAPNGVNFDTHAAFKTQEKIVYERAVLAAHAFLADPNGPASPMPPAGLPSEADRKRLAQWIACGSPLP